MEEVLASLLTAKYLVVTKDYQKAAHAIAKGQTIGNPFLESKTDAAVKTFLAETEVDPPYITVKFPVHNFGNYFHVSYLLSVLMGGQCDIDIIEGCRLIDIDLSAVSHNFLYPKYGITGIRKMLGVYDRPLVGTIIKPKIGFSPSQIADVCKQLADGGADFIKEDEILNFQEWCPIEERIEKVTKALQGHKTIYAPCVTSDDYRMPIQGRVSFVHLNWWSGFGHYMIMRKHFDCGLFFQKSGDKVITTGPYSIDYSVICKLINAIGCDFAHIGMNGGYLNEKESTIRSRISALSNTMPSFSCGAEPRHVQDLASKFGKDIMITSGGYIHAHPKGITYAVKEFRDEADKTVPV